MGNILVTGPGERPGRTVSGRRSEDGKDLESAVHLHPGYG